MAQIHSTYGINTGTGLQTGLTITGVIVPSVVDGLLAFCWGLDTGSLTALTGIGSTDVPISIRQDSDATSPVIVSSIQFLPRPDVGTYDFVLAFNSAATRGGLFIILLTGTKTSEYYTGHSHFAGFGTGAVTNPGFVANDFEADMLVYNNRDANGAPTGIGSGQTIIHNTTINSGGGSSSYGFCISVKYPTSTAEVSWTIGGFSLAVQSAITLKNSNFNAPGLLTIRHAP